jgi:pSer/pThr/pTyr-binding forkhead associated (FHA) protein
MDGDGFFVDPSPSALVERPSQDPRRGRAADRRRERGRAPEPAAPKDTRTAMPRPEDFQPRRSTGQHARPAPAERDSSALAMAPTGIVAAGGGAGLRGTLTCMKGPEAGQALPLTLGSYTIGRARENHLVLKDIAASRKHLQIDVDTLAARLTDLGSGNGTRVNGKRAATVTLRHGDTIEIGSSLLVFAEAGREDPVDGDAREEAQARVVAAADELARELHEKLRFGEGGTDDGYVARTQALRAADARAGADALARERDAAKTPRKRNEREWNETFTNMPLSAVVPGEQPLQGTQAHRADPRAAKAKAPLPAPMPPRAAGPMGTAVADSIDDGAPVEESRSVAAGSPFVTGLLTAGAVVLVTALGIGAWALLRDEGAAPPPPRTVDAASQIVAQEREADFQRALDGMKAAYQQGDWVRASAYASTALQLHPDDALARRYLQDAEDKQKAATVTTNAATTNAATTNAATTNAATTNAATTNAATTNAATTNAAAPGGTEPLPGGSTASAGNSASPVTTTTTTATPVPSTVQPPKAPDPPAPPPSRPRADPPPRTRKPATAKPSTSRRGMSEDEAKALFDQAITAFKNKETDDGCKLLDRIVDRAPSDSRWHEKASVLFGKRCSE